MRIIALLTAGLLSLAAAAQPKEIAHSEIEARYSAEFADCLRDGMATADTVFCVDTEAKLQEPKMEKALQAALKRVPPKRRGSARAAQSKWVRDSRARCDEEVKDEPFERVADARRGQCMLDEIIRRTIELERLR